MNAIQAERIHQAYLLTGSRGIGKTSIARIFAKAVRCEKTTVENGSLRSCSECTSCKEIAAGNSVDVIEIDGASNNGVDAVREIRENAKYLPSSGRRKIYIIDEVHMLTTAAFNALLKTLEEPPAHVIFIVATTEPHKIPATILSRCQRFDLRRVNLAQIQMRLVEVTASEKVQAETGGLALIARAAEGSMRDALSLLDQVIAFAGNTISTQAVRESIGLIEGQTVLGILSGVFNRKPLEALALVEQAYSQGHDLKLLNRTLIEFLHGAILAKLGAAGSATLELSEEEWKELKTISESRSLEEIELIFQVLHHGLEWIARSPQPKIVLDVLLIKCATAEALVQINNSAAVTSTPAAPSVAKAASVVAPTTAKAVTQVSPASVVNPSPSAVQPTVALRSNESLVPPSIGSSMVQGSWEGFIAHVRPTRPLLASMLEHGICESLPTNDPKLTVCFRLEDAYFRDQLQSRVYAEQLGTLSKDYFQKHVQVVVELKDSGESVAVKRERERKDRETAARTAAQNHPIIAEARALFGGELGPIEISGSGSDNES